MLGVGSTTTAAVGDGGVRGGGGGGRPYGVGLMAWALEQDRGPFDAALAAAPALVSVGFGDYPKYVGPLQAAGVTVATQAGNLDEAKAAEQAGVDVIVARGSEGGGHGRNDVAHVAVVAGRARCGHDAGARGRRDCQLTRPGRGARGRRGRCLGGDSVHGLRRGGDRARRARAVVERDRHRHRLRAGLRRRAGAGLAAGVRRSVAAQRVLRALGRTRGRAGGTTRARRRRCAAPARPATTTPPTSMPVRARRCCTSSDPLPTSSRSSPVRRTCSRRP